MAQSQPSRTDRRGIRQLLAIQAQFLKLVAQNSALAGEVRAAGEEYRAIRRRVEDAKEADRRRIRDRARSILRRGLVVDPSPALKRRCDHVVIHGLFPMHMVERMQRINPLHPKRAASADRKWWAEGGQKRLAKAMLQAMDWDERFQARETSEKARDAMRRQHRARKRKGNVEAAEFFVWFVPPPRMPLPPDPRGLKPSELSRLSDEEYMTVALHTLGGLADMRAGRPLVPPPPERGTRSSHRRPDYSRNIEQIDHAVRFPRELGEDRPMDGAPDPHQLDPDVAREMLAFVANRTQARLASFAMRDEHMTVLCELAKRDRLTKATELEAVRGQPSYDRLLDLLRELESAGYVARPKGARSGYQISEEGKEQLRRRDLLGGPAD